MARTAHRTTGSEPCGLLPSLNHRGRIGAEQWNPISHSSTYSRDLTAKQANAPVSSILLSIISTVFADSRWKTPFELNDTEPAVFHGDQGDATMPFMHQRCEDVSYLCDETFGWERVDIPFDDGSELRIVLPAPGTLETLVHDLIALRRAFSTELAVTIPQADKQELTDMDRLKAKLAARKNPASMPIYANTVTAKVALPRFENRQHHQRKNTGQHPAFIGHHRRIRFHACRFHRYMRRGARHQPYHAGHAHRSQRAWGASRRVHRN